MELIEEESGNYCLWVPNRRWSK